MVEADIEKKIIDRLKGLNIPDIGIFGMWNDPTDMIGNKELANQRGYCVVKVPTRGFDTFGICEVDFDIIISLVIRVEMCKSGNEIAKIVEPIVGVLTGWNLIESDDELTDFMVDGFYPAGVQINQGGGPDIDRGSKTWSTTFNLNLKGTIGCPCKIND